MDNLLLTFLASSSSYYLYIVLSLFLKERPIKIYIFPTLTPFHCIWNLMQKVCLGKRNTQVLDEVVFVTNFQAGKNKHGKTV